MSLSVRENKYRMRRRKGKNERKERDEEKAVILRVGRQLVKHLRCKLKGLGSVSRTHIKKPGLWARACHPSTGKKETRGCLGLAGQPP